MDNRTPLIDGFNLTLGDITYTIQKLIGFGSNAFVYLACYGDNLQKDKKHRVLIKELFPYHPRGLIYRNEYGDICFADEARDYFNLHKKSFLHGNAYHLDIQNTRADMASVNINSFEKKGTLYTVLGDSNGETLLTAAGCGTFTASLSGVVNCMLGILDALDVFHKNGLLHLDISPDNILLMPSGCNDEQYRHIVLIDYNSTWNIDDFSENANVYFSIKEHYSAPEVRIQDKNSISFATDLFSVCAVFLEYLQGKPLDFSILYSGGKLIDSDSGLLADIPATAAEKALAIVKKGLKLPPRQRYQSIESLRSDFIELKNRINGIGITHSALWEASKANFQNYVQKNKKYGYLFNKENILPCNVKLNGDSTCSFYEAIKILSKSVFPHVQITAAGGMGKTTALMMLWKNGISSYNPGSAVPVYIPLYNYKAASIPYIKGCLLERLKFDDKTTTVEDAMRSLDNLLDTGGGRSSVLFLLDGLNEAACDKGLLLEISELMKKTGVQIILTSRAEKRELVLNNLEILYLNEYEIKNYLNKHNILFPAEKALQNIITNHMMLSVYRITSQMEEKTVDVYSAEELLDEYMKSLLKTHRERTAGSREEQLQAEYAIAFLLPAVVHRMKQLGSVALTSKEVYRAVKDCFNLLTQKSFLMCNPQYIGRSKLIRGQAKTPEEWFNDIVNILLCDKFALLCWDEHGNCMLSHQNFYDYFLKKYNMENKKLGVAKRKRSIPYIAAMCLSAVALIFIGIKVSENIRASYPETVQEMGMVENAMTAAADSLSRLGMQIKNDTDILESYSNGYDEFITVYKRNKAVNRTLVLNDGYSEDEIRLFVPPGSPVPFVTLKELLNAGGDYNAWSEGMFEGLNRVLSGESKYPEKDRLHIIELYKQYLEGYTDICYIKLQLVIMPLNEDGRKTILDALPYMAVFGDKFADQPFIDSRAELESALKAENVKLKDISAELKSYGMKG